MASHRPHVSISTGSILALTLALGSVVAACSSDSSSNNETDGGTGGSSYGTGGSQSKGGSGNGGAAGHAGASGSGGGAGGMGGAATGGMGGGMTGGAGGMGGAATGGMGGGTTGGAGGMGGAATGGMGGTSAGGSSGAGGASPGGSTGSGGAAAGGASGVPDGGPDACPTPAPLTRPSVDASLEPPAGAVLERRLHGVGSQIYVCTATRTDDATTYGWTLKAPQANLFDDACQAVGTHFAGPTWEWTVDQSTVKGSKVAGVNSPTSIPWLLLKAVAHTGTGVFSTITYVQRVDTEGGVAPATGCGADTVDAEQPVAYSATYYFYSGGVPDGG
jgi:hypothetical protein